MEVAIPLERLTVRASRSGGPGGQNVNKVSSRIEVRFALDDADWIQPAVRARLRQLFPGRVTKGGEFLVVSSRHRDQRQNLQDCLKKIGEFLEAAAERPRPRIPTSPTRSAGRRRLELKRRRSEKKRGRRGAGDAE
jgi:ribosome-associated protein